jgi:hypothetical protein
MKLMYKQKDNPLPKVVEFRFMCAQMNYDNTCDVFFFSHWEGYKDTAKKPYVRVRHIAVSAYELFCNTLTTGDFLNIAKFCDETIVEY